MDESLLFDDADLHPATPSLHPFTRRLCHHPAVKRLHHISQLGVSHHIYPGLEYSRLFHSISVADLARDVAVVLPLTAQQKLAVEVAGLLHDVGHGPWSHTFDKALSSLKNSPPHWLIQHEDRSVRLTQHILSPVANQDFTATVCALINPTLQDEAPTLDGVANPPWMFQLVANKQHGIDVDRLSYLICDTLLYNDEVPDAQEWKCPIITLQEVKNFLQRQTTIIDNQWAFHTTAQPLIERVLEVRTLLHRKMYSCPQVLALEFAYIEHIHKDIANNGDRYKCLGLRNDQECRDFLNILQDDLKLDQYQWTSEPQQKYSHILIMTDVCDKYNIQWILPTIPFYDKTSIVVATRLSNKNQTFCDTTYFYK